MKRTMMWTLALGLAAGAQAQKVTLEFWAHWGSEQRRPTINKILETWNKKNPNVQVKYTFVPFDQIQTKTLAGVAAGNAPDVVVIDIRTSKIRASKKQNTNLSPLGAEKLSGDYYPNLWATGAWKGDQYALPFVTDTRFLYYNKDAFKEVGLNPAKPPRTWAELEEYARRLDKKTGPVYQRVGFYPLYGNFGYEGWVQNAKSSLWDDDFENPRVNNAAALRTLNWIKGWAERLGPRSVQAFKSSFGSGAQDPFISGRLAMHVEGANYAATLKRYTPNFEYGIVRVPTPDGETHDTMTWGGGFNVELPAGGKHAKEAYAFARWFTTEGARIWAREQNDFPANKSASFAVTTPEFRLMSANIKYSVVNPAPTYAPTYGGFIDKAVDDVIDRDVDPKKALDDAQAQVQKIVNDNKR